MSLLIRISGGCFGHREKQVQQGKVQLIFGKDGKPFGKWKSHTTQVANTQKAIEAKVKEVMGKLGQRSYQYYNAEDESGKWRNLRCLLDESVKKILVATTNEE